MRLQTFSEDSVSDSTVGFSTAQHVVRTYKEQLKNRCWYIVVGDDGDSLVPVNVNKVTNIAPIENATSFRWLKGKTNLNPKPWTRTC